MAELDSSVQELLRGKNFAFVATVNSDGWPHVTPTWVDTDGQHVLVNTALGTVKQRNIKRDPRVTLVVMDQTNPYKAFIIRGRVVEQIVGSNAEAHLDALAKRYMGSDAFPDREVAAQQVILKIEPLRVNPLGPTKARR
jgi:PPOX class probable F420-dependent enzyme